MIELFHCYKFQGVRSPLVVAAINVPAESEGAIEVGGYTPRAFKAFKAWNTIVGDGYLTLGQKKGYGIPSLNYYTLKKGTQYREIRFDLA